MPFNCLLYCLIVGTKVGEERVKCVPLPAGTAGCPASVSCLNTLTQRNISHLLKAGIYIGVGGGGSREIQTHF